MNLVARFGTQATVTQWQPQEVAERQNHAATSEMEPLDVAVSSLKSVYVLFKG